MTSYDSTRKWTGVSDIIFSPGINCQYDNLPELTQACLVTQACLGCICEGISGCNVTSTCQGEVCGPFRITWPYWADAGKPTVNNEGPSSDTAYKNCALDTFCSALAVQGYMQKYQQDCNNDGKIDCDDYAAIHKLGGYGCQGQLPYEYNRRYQQYINAEYDDPVSPACLTRICKVMSGCRTSRCYDSYCGAFRMSRPFWVDGGMPTFKNEDPESEMAYENCAMDIFCSAKTVQGYMTKFRQDCNGDGKIDCDDYYDIHRLGGYGCGNREPSGYQNSTREKEY
ncbi:destabilase-related [Holotrichia oblita]|uniref:Destabilase-related n=1 Tax=Holotrichia oblita TaxID=644536 RepID=A0ACB9SQZ2_HOLOL|nr:destabilase-related [Holotrichia oblita]